MSLRTYRCIMGRLLPRAAYPDREEQRARGGAQTKCGGGKGISSFSSISSRGSRCRLGSSIQSRASSGEPSQQTPARRNNHNTAAKSISRASLLDAHLSAKMPAFHHRENWCLALLLTLVTLASAWPLSPVVGAEINSVQNHHPNSISMNSIPSSSDLKINSTEHRAGGSSDLIGYIQQMAGKAPSDGDGAMAATTAQQSILSVIPTFSSSAQSAGLAKQVSVLPPDSAQVETMMTAASKKKKKMKMMKKKKKMEKKHKEWKKGKKHKKKKFESKKKKGGSSKKKKGKKEKKKWGMEKKGHKKKGNFKKKKWGEKKKMKKGHKKGKKGHKMLKDKGHKKKGFKKIYHKEEWGKKKKWHDIKREKKWNTKQKKWKKKWHQEKGKKYKGKHMKKYHKKNKHGKKYKKEKKSKWKKHKGEKFKKGHKKKKEEYSKKKEGGKKKKMKKMKKEMKKKKKG